MKLTKALMMAILLVLAGLYVWDAERKRPVEQLDQPTDMPKSDFPKQLFPDLNLADINRIGMKHSDQGFDFVKNQNQKDPVLGEIPPEGKYGTWVMLSPAGAPTNPRKISALLDALGGAKIYNQISSEELEDELSAYGFDKPALWLVFATTDGETLLEFGKKVGMSGRRYMKLRGEKKIALVDDNWFQKLLLEKDQVRNQFPAMNEPRNVLKLTIKRQHLDDIVIERSGFKPGGNWEISKELKDTSLELDDRLINQALVDLASLKVKHFADNVKDRLITKSVSRPKTIISLEMLSPHGDSEAKAQIKTLGLFFGELTKTVKNDKKKSEQTLRRTHFYLRVAGKPWIYEMERAVPLDLQQPLEHFRNKSPFSSVKSESITKILLWNSESEDPSFLLQRSGDNWKAALGPNFDVADFEVSGDKLSWWIERFQTFRVLTYPVLTVEQQRKYQVDNPVFRAEVFVEGRLESYKLVVAAPVELALDTKKEGSSKKSEEEINQLPRFAVLRSYEELKLSAIVGHLNWRPLVKDLEFFLSSQ